MIKVLFYFWPLISAISPKKDSSFLGNLRTGPYQVGFRIFNQEYGNGTPMIICLWYPADAGGDAMHLSDYIETGILQSKEDKKRLRNEFKQTLELPFLYNLGTIPDSKYENCMSRPLKARHNAAMKKGKWPVILMDSEPASLCFTNEWFASHGFIVAVSAANFRAPANDSLLYEEPMIALGHTLDFILKQPFTDTSKLLTLGFGGGSMAPFYLSMRASNIKAMANIEGGIFMPLSKTTLSKNYYPQRFNVPFLHIVTPEIIAREKIEEFQAIRARPNYRITILSSRIKHHDFTTYGRVVAGGLNRRGEDTEIATKVFSEIYESILHFLRSYEMNDSVISSGEMYKLEKF